MFEKAAFVSILCILCAVAIFTGVKKTIQKSFNEDPAMDSYHSETTNERQIDKTLDIKEANERLMDKVRSQREKNEASMERVRAMMERNKR